VKSLCRALLVLNVLYCLLAAAQEGVPGWHMFESVEPLDHELRDRAGERVDVRAALPRGANLVDRGELRKIVAFVCAKEAARGPFTYVEPSKGLEVRLDPGAGPDGCKVHGRDAAR
jgi:hypothetical protein